jgi:hypothetical protein
MALLKVICWALIFIIRTKERINIWQMMIFFTLIENMYQICTVLVAIMFYLRNFTFFVFCSRLGIPMLAPMLPEEE